VISQAYFYSFQNEESTLKITSRYNIRDIADVVLSSGFLPSVICIAVYRAVTFGCW
jgi:hypothetical protein